MKKIIFVLAVAMSVSATMYAEKNSAEKWDVSVNPYRLSQYLGLNTVQADQAEEINLYFAQQMRNARYSKSENQAERVQKAVYNNLGLMKNALTQEQYVKYMHVLNVTLRNKGLDSYMNLAGTAAR